MSVSGWLRDGWGVASCAVGVAGRSGGVSTPEAIALSVYDDALDAALNHRVSLHEERQAKRIDVPTYLAGLKAVRAVEEALEPLRRGLGAADSRALITSLSEAAA
jgi:acyl-CoA hydrolase